MLESDVPEFALIEKLFQGVSQKIVGVRLQPIARRAVRLVMVALTASEKCSQRTGEKQVFSGAR